MFIRKTRIVNRATKKPYFNFQLVESVRTERGPRQKILLNLGTDVDLKDKQECKLLANRIEEIIVGANTMFPCSDKIECYAQKYALEIRNQLSISIQERPPLAEAEYQTIDIHTIEQQEPRTVGAEHILLHAADQLEISKILRSLGLTDKEIALSLATIIGRATFPASERATHAWVTQGSGLGELINHDFQKTTLDDFYRVSDILLKNKAALENHLERAGKALHKYQSTLVLYDMTNTYLEGRSKSNSKAKHGVSKEKRFDCPLVTLGLVINEHGFLVRSSFLPGNISEPTTLKDAIETLHGPDLFKPIIVMDAGIATDENLLWLRNNKYSYIVAARQKAPTMKLAGSLISTGATSSEVKVAFIKTEEENEQWLYCESEAKKVVSSEMKKMFQDRFETSLKKLAEGLLKPRGRKKYIKIVERLGRLKEKHSCVSGCYDITVECSADGQQATAIHWIVKSEKLSDKLNGHYFLRTNLKSIAPDDLWRLYSTLGMIETSFRFMKSALGLRPVYHQKERRVDGHIWITILAYHLIHTCMYQLKKTGITYEWEKIRNCLSTRTRVTICAKTENGKMFYHRSTTKVEEHQREIYQALNLSPQISKAKKIIL